MSNRTFAALFTFLAFMAGYAASLLGRYNLAVLPIRVLLISATATLLSWRLLTRLNTNRQSGRSSRG